MNYKDIKDFYQRCEEHKDHQSGMISYGMISQRLQEEINELREYIEQRKPLTDEEIMNIAKASFIGISPHEDALNFAKVIEAAHGIKENT